MWAADRMPRYSGIKMCSYNYIVFPNSNYNDNRHIVNKFFYLLYINYRLVQDIIIVAYGGV